MKHAITIRITGAAGAGKSTAMAAISAALAQAGFGVAAVEGRHIERHGDQHSDYLAHVSVVEGVEESMQAGAEQLQKAQKLLEELGQLRGIPREVVQAINAEFDYQDAKHGPDRRQTLPGYLLVMESELLEAKLGWNKNLTGRSSALHEVVQTVAVGLRCLRDHGTEGNG